MDISEDRNADAVILALSGKLDATNAKTFEDKILSLINSGAPRPLRAEAFTTCPGFLCYTSDKRTSSLSRPPVWRWHYSSPAAQPVIAPVPLLLYGFCTLLAEPMARGRAARWSQQEGFSTARLPLAATEKMVPCSGYDPTAPGLRVSTRSRLEETTASATSRITIRCYSSATCWWGQRARVAIPTTTTARERRRMAMARSFGSRPAAQVIPSSRSSMAGSDLPRPHTVRLRSLLTAECSTA